MPVITVDIGILPNRETKAELVKALTKAASSTTQIPEDKFIVLIKEREKDNIGIGGKLLSDILE
ncbi:MAG TPA: 4-oxalocrotonate tautomerase DmpI [Geomonas sp.]